MNFLNKSLKDESRPKMNCLFGFDYDLGLRESKNDTLCPVEMKDKIYDMFNKLDDIYELKNKISDSFRIK